MYYIYPIWYRQASYTNTVTGVVTKGSPVIFTLTIPSTASNIQGAITLANYLKRLGQSDAALRAEGLFSIQNQSFVGDLATVPALLLSAL